jgi:7-cyano-7-deazaguanine synthase
MRSVVLLSAGLDSSLNLYEAMQNSEVLMALTFDYGQRAAAQELKHARQLAQLLKIEHLEIKLEWMKNFGTSSLTNSALEIPTHQVRIDDLQTSQATAKSVWVPNRNGIFLNIAAGFAESLSADWIVPGFNIEEAATFSDNSQEFLTSLNQSFFFSTSNHVQVKCFTTKLDKTQIVARGLELHIDFNLIWPCYFAGPRPCAKCESCLRFVRALHQNKLTTDWMKV